MANEVWTNPRDWVDGETPTGSIFNVHVRDNLKYLKQAPSYDGSVAVGDDLAVVGDVTVGGTMTAVGGVNTSGNMNVAGQLYASANVVLGDTPADLVQINGTIINAPLRNYTETRSDAVISAGALTLDCQAGTYFRVTLNANHTVAIANPPAAGRVLGISIIYTADGVVRTVVWPPQVVWASGVAPTMTGAANKRDWITLVSDDGGVTWFGCIVGQNY